MQDLPENSRAMAGFVDQLVSMVERADQRSSRLEAAGFYEETLRDISSSLGGAQCCLIGINHDNVTLIAGTDPPAELLANAGATSPETHQVLNFDGSRFCVSCQQVSTDLRILLAVEVTGGQEQTQSIGEVLIPMVRLFADVTRRSRVDLLERRLDRQNLLISFLSGISNHDNRHALCSQFATEGTDLLDVERIAVLVGQSGRYSLDAVTGAVDPHPRSNSRRLLESLANKTTDQCELDEWHTPEGLDCTRESHAAAVACMQDSQSTQIRVHRPDSNCTLILERYSEPGTADLIPAVSNHFAKSLTRTQQSLSNRIVSSVLQWRWIALFLLLSVIALSVIQVDFEVEAIGTLQPVNKRNVFAPEEGVIEDVFPVFVSRTASGSPLLVISNPQIELERERLNGQLEAANNKLIAVQARPSFTEAERFAASATQEELECQIESLEKQIEIIQRQFASLTVHSPIAGRVFRRDLKESLLDRPVRKGQFLLQVADTEGEWQLDLRIKDTMIRHVTGAATNELPTVRYVSQMAPDQDYSGRMQWISPVTTLEPNGTLSVRATVDVPADKLKDLRPGSGIVARIDCGQRSLGYAWFHQILDFVRTRLLF